MVIDDAELEQLLKQLIEDLPDFNYIQLKKVFRRTGTAVEELIVNLDRKFAEWDRTAKE
ncbi:MAG: hypothetical protein ACFFD4_21225 [Candidatus Odinarchaeota archaeon]